MTIAIVALNVLVFVVFGPADENRQLAEVWGFIPGHPSPGSAITAAFIHADLWHLAGNMIFLLATAPFLEDAYGRVLFLVVYLGSAISGSYAWAELGWGRYVIGASGAIFGLEGAFAIRFGARYLRFFLAPIGFLPFLGFRIRVRAAIVLLFGFLEQLLLLETTGSRIAFGAHVGGFAFGLVAAAVVRAAGIEERWIHPAIEAQIGWHQHPLLTRAGEARFAGDPIQARRDAWRALAQDPRNADGWALAARVALDLGDGADAVRCAERAIPLYLERRESDPAADVALDVLRKARPSLTPQFGSMAAALMERRGQTVDAIWICEELAARFPEDEAGRRANARAAELRLEKAPEVALRRRMRS